MAKKFDTTEIKSTALNTIVSRAEALERALFNRAEARAKLDAEHTKLITDASIALDRAQMEALQSGVDAEDYERFLPEYEEDLSERLEELIQLTQLAKAAELL